MFLQQTKFFLQICAVTFAIAFVTSAQTATPTPVEDDDPVRVDTEEIKVNVSAFDRYGEFVPEVDKKDLVIMEDDRLHQATSVRRIPANVLIVLDTGGELRQIKNMTQTRETAKALVRKLDSGNSIAILEYHDKARILTEWTTNKFKVYEDLDKKLIFGRRSIFTDALKLATEFLSKSEVENRHLVLITDGTDSLWSDERRAEVLQKLLGTNINVHVISYTRLELTDIEPRAKGIQKGQVKKALPPEVIETLPNGVRDVAKAPQMASVNTDRKFIKTMKERQEALEKSEKYLLNLSESTSGLFILPDDQEEMIEKTALVAKAIDSNYVVTYTPKRPLSESKTGETRNIEVSSRKQGLQVLAKRKLVVSGENK
jgi:Mg-chelatase subunit ChlD